MEGTITSYCECCWTHSVQKSVSDPLSKFCAGCRGHIHSAENLRADHRMISEQARVARVVEDAAKVAHLTEKIGQLEATLIVRSNTIASLQGEKKDLTASIVGDLSDGLAPELEKALRNEVLSDLQKAAQEAYRTRDRAMAAVWRVVERHHEGLDRKCSCGKVADNCSDLQAVDWFRVPFERWEKKQTELMRADKRHGLPRDHPESRKWDDPHRIWWGMPATKPEAHSGRRA